MVINPLHCVLLTLGLEWKRSSTAPVVGTIINYRYRENFWRSFENIRNTEVSIDIVRWTEIVHKRDFCLPYIMTELNFSRNIFYIYIKVFM